MFKIISLSWVHRSISCDFFEMGSPLLLLLLDYHILMLRNVLFGRLFLVFWFFVKKFSWIKSFQTMYSIFLSFPTYVCMSVPFCCHLLGLPHTHMLNWFCLFHIFIQKFRTQFYAGYLFELLIFILSFEIILILIFIKENFFSWVPLKEGFFFFSKTVLIFLTSECYQRTS